MDIKDVESTGKLVAMGATFLGIVSGFYYRVKTQGSRLNTQGKDIDEIKDTLSANGDKKILTLGILDRIQDACEKQRHIELQALKNDIVDIKESTAEISTHMADLALAVQEVSIKVEERTKRLN